MKRAATLIVILLVICSLILLSGCQQAKPVEKPKVINISYSFKPVNVPTIVAVEKKMFEEEFAKEGIEVKWHELEGPATTEALAAKSVDFSISLNYVSAIISKANGNDIKIISSYSKFPKGIGLVAHNDSNITSVADLKGKKIALQKGTMLHEMLIRALEEQKMTVKDVELVGMASADAANALLQKHVDAAIIPEPLLSKVISSNNAKLIKNAEGLILGQAVIAARSEFLQKYPAIAKKFIEIHSNSLNWVEKNKNEALEISSKVNKMDVKAVNALYPKFDFSIAIDENNITELKEAVSFLKDNNFIKADQDPENLIKNLVDTSFINK